MTSHTPIENALTDTVNQIKNQIANATDVNKLFKNSKFMKQLNTLPGIKQFEIFKEYKDKFDQINKDPKSAITAWTGNLAKSFPILEKNPLNDGIQQTQKILDDLRNSLGQISPK